MAKVKFNFKKFDFTRIKNFFFDKGEKIALGIILALGGFLVFNGLSNARNAARTESGTLFKDAIRSGATQLESAIKNARSDQPPPSPFDKDTVVWAARISTFPFTPFIMIPETGDFKRRNPAIVTAYSNSPEKTSIQIDYLRAGVQVYEIDREGAKGGTVNVVVPSGTEKVAINPGADKKSGNFAVNLRPKRMVVVHALFPMREQLQEYAKALKLTWSELLLKQDRSDWPHLLGLNITRIEEDGKGQARETKLYWYDPQQDLRMQNKIKVADHLDSLFREAVMDEDGLLVLGSFNRYPGLMAPFPKLTNGTYPPVKLEGIKLEEVVAATEGEEKDPQKKTLPGTGTPPPGTSILGKKTNPLDKTNIEDPARPRNELRAISWKKIPDVLADKFKGDYLVFDAQPMPQFDDKKVGTGPFSQPFVDPRQTGSGGTGAPISLIPDKKSFGVEKAATGDPRLSPPTSPPTGSPGGEDPKVAGGGKDFDPSILAKFTIPDALIRFIDVDVEPGKTYRYKFQVRALNPNYKQKEKVAALNLADVKEIVSQWTVTPPVSIPRETFLYTMDQVDYDPGRKMGIPRGPDHGRIDEMGAAGIPVRAPIQIHRWFGKTMDRGKELLIADWAIAERLLVRRGEFLGRRDVMVQVPTWNDLLGDFEVLSTAPATLPKKGAFPAPPRPAPAGVALDFSLGQNPPLLLDLEGGMKKGRTHIDEYAMELLILNPNGKMVVRNTRQDADPDTPEGKDRLQRHEAYRNRLNQILNAPPPSSTPGMPGSGSPSTPSRGSPPSGTN